MTDTSCSSSIRTAGFPADSTSPGTLNRQSPGWAGGGNPPAVPNHTAPRKGLSMEAGRRPSGHRRFGSRTDGLGLRVALAPSTLQSLPPLRGKIMSWDDDFPGARASRPRSQVPNQQLINPFIAVHSCPFVVRRSPSCLSSWPFTDPFRVFSNPLESLGRSSWPFVDKFLPFRPSWITAPPFPTLGGSLSSLLQPLSGPSPFFVALRGYLFAFSPFVDNRSPLPDHWRVPLKPPPTP